MPRKKGIISFVEKLNGHSLWIVTPFLSSIFTGSPLVVGARRKCHRGRKLYCFCVELKGRQIEPLVQNHGIYGRDWNVKKPLLRKTFSSASIEITAHTFGCKSLYFFVNASCATFLELSQSKVDHEESNAKKETQKNIFGSVSGSN